MYGGYRRPLGRRWLRWLLAYCLGTAIVFAVGLVVKAAISPAPVRPRDSGQASPALSPAGSPASRQGPAPAALAGPLAVGPGSQVINGVALGFPHSTTGAVSAAVSVATEIGGTLDPDRAAAVMRMVADPSYPGAPQQAAQGAVNERRSLGIPASGPVPGGDSMQVLPVEYQVPSASADQATVLLLCDLVITRPGAGTRTTFGVLPFRMHWAQADWKVASIGSDSYSGLAAEPGGPRAASLGWQLLRTGG